MNLRHSILSGCIRAAAAGLSLGLAACGANVSNLGNVGGASSDGGIAGAIAQGIFRDSNVTGLGFSADTQSGVTDADGTFKYIVGGNISFSVGAVALGTTAAKSVITPLDIVATGTTSNNQVVNIARFLMYLDKDAKADSVDGIVISQAVQDLAKNWPQIDFSVTPAEFDTALAATSIPTDLSGVSGETHTLPAATAAQTHLRKMLLCTYQGAFGGNFTGGEDSGIIGVYLDPRTGRAFGYTYGTNATVSSLTGDSPINFDAYLPDVAMSDIGLDRSYDFQFSTINGISGHWGTGSTGSGSSNTFSAARIGGDQTLHSHFAGGYTTRDNSDAGVMAFNIASTVTPDNISISGELFTVQGNTSLVFSGQIGNPDGNGIRSLTAQTSDNRSFQGSINSNDLTFTGTWSRVVNPALPPVVAGDFSGSGCEF